ncbi:MAG: hypothetical protein KTR31_36035 [Myxococcales bacterium]|nr:hypothetical protein [Myxococcales bacterium]
MSLTPRQRAYGRALAVCYALAAGLHGLDASNTLAEDGWPLWSLGMAFVEAIAAVGLWWGKRWGAVAFLTVASVQLLVYGTTLAFGGVVTHLLAAAVVTFHVVTIVGFILVRRHSLGPFEA